MITSRINLCALCLLFIGTLSGCKKETFDFTDFSQYADDSFKSKDYGDLPALPSNLNIKSGSFISFLSQSGEFKQAIVKEPTTVFLVKDGKKTECKLEKGDKVYVVASVETEDAKRYAIIQPAKPCIFQNPRTNELIPISEGYSDLSNLEFIADTAQLKTENIGEAVNAAPVLAGAGPGCLRMSQTFHGSECNVAGTPCGIPGYLLRAGAPGFNIKIVGTAPKWVVTVQKVEGGGAQPTPRRVYDSSALTRTPDGGYLVPMAALLGVTSDWSFATVRFSAQAATGDGLAFGSVCTHQFYSASPLVMDFSPSQKDLRSIPLAQSNVKFDLDGSGIKKQTGWIYPYAGFLAIDRNKNGVIDNGSELFGQFSQVTDKLNRFGNGFLALKYYDSNRDGFIDANDRDFKDLLVWKDENMDGISQFSEIRSLNVMKVNRISTTYETRALDKNIFVNQAPFVAKFWGPSYCGKVGCNVFDIFFRTTDSVQLTGVMNDR